MLRAFPAALLFAALALAPLSGAVGQGPDWDSRRPVQTRAALQDLLQRLEQAAESPGYSSALRAQARAEAELVRQRLAVGDFQVGDRILLWVEGEAQLTDTFSVTAGPAVLLPVVGEIPLAGVLRSELQSHLTEHLGRVLRLPIVRARSLIRLSVLGAVGRPGFYVLPIETLPEEALMAAGGPTSNARLSALRVERGATVLWEGKVLARAMTEGRTLDDLSLRAGDQLILPGRGGSTTEKIRIVGFLLGLPATIYALTRLF